MIDRHFRAPHRFAASILVAAFVVLLSGCELFGEAAIVQEIQDATGIDVNDPLQVGGAAVGGALLGSKDAQDGVAVLEGYQRARHEQAGDNYFFDGRYPLARQEYQEALRWANTGTNTGKEKAADLHRQTAETYEMEGWKALVAADKTNDPVLKADLQKAYRAKNARAAEEAERAGDIAPDPFQKALAYGHQADFLRASGQPSAACDTAKKAYNLNPDPFMQTYVDFNCK